MEVDALSQKLFEAVVVALNSPHEILMDFKRTRLIALLEEDQQTVMVSLVIQSDLVERIKVA